VAGLIRHPGFYGFRRGDPMGSPVGLGTGIIRPAIPPRAPARGCPYKRRVFGFVCRGNDVFVGATLCGRPWPVGLGLSAP